MATREQLRFEQLLSSQEADLRKAFAVFARDARSDQTLKAINDKLASRDYGGALRIVDQFVMRLGTTIPQVFQQAGREEIEALKGKFAGGTAVSLAFDPTDPRTAALMRQNQLRFIRDFTQEQRRAVRRALSEAYEAGAGTLEAARTIQRSIGLTEAQVVAGENYARALEEGSREALDRALRDRRFDRTVSRAIRLGKPLAAEAILRMVSRYRDRQLASRAETIARTEGVRISNIARREALTQALETMGVSKTQVRRTWNSSDDKRTRDSHRSMDGQEVGMEEPFKSGAGHSLMFPGDPSAPAEEVINCRCVVTHRVM